MLSCHVYVILPVALRQTAVRPTQAFGRLNALSHAVATSQTPHTRVWAQHDYSMIPSTRPSSALHKHLGLESWDGTAALRAERPTQAFGLSTMFRALAKHPHTQFGINAASWQTLPASIGLLTQGGNFNTPCSIR